MHASAEVHCPVELPSPGRTHPGGTIGRYHCIVTTAKHPLLPWLVWFVAAIAYSVAIMNRSSLASLGPVAQTHFGIDATALSAFAVIQLVVYASMQIPVGILLDRFGPTALVLSGGVLMILGQIAMATVHEVSLAILARVFVGVGDACTFISVMRMLPDWFSVRHLPTLGQVTALIGQTGQLVSVTPLAIVVGAYGWASGFIGVAAVGLLVSIIGFFVLRDRPGLGTTFERMTGRVGRASREATSLGSRDNTEMLAAVAPPETGMLAVIGAGGAGDGRARRLPGLGFWRRVRRLLSVPGVRLAYWVHFTSPFASTVFVLLWGTPFLTGGVGLSQAAAGGLLSLTIVSGMIAGLLLGPISSRFAERRVLINLASVIGIVVVWTVVLLWPGTPPVWLLAVQMVVIAIGGPASMIAFEVGRSHTPQSFSGFGTGLVNTGGFTSALLVIFLVGLALDLQGAGSPERYTLEAFKWAFAVQIPFWALGITMMLVELRKTRGWMQKHGRTLR